MPYSLVQQSLFQAAIALIGSAASAGCAVLYFRRIRLERPPVGVFNGRDLVILSVFIILLPMLYLILPSFALTGFLILTFVSALYICLRPLLRTIILWPVIAALIGINIVVAETLLSTRQGWQLYWVLTSIAVLLAAVGVSNLYVQGGLRLRLIARFALFLAAYDAFFSLVIPLTPKLADAFEGRPLDPSIGFTMGIYNANIGLGDLLIYCLFAVAAYKGYGMRGLLTSAIIIPIFGALLPGLAPLALHQFIRGGVGIVVPAQAFFGPVAFLAYRLLARTGEERSMRTWFAVQAAMQQRIVMPRRRPTMAPQLSTGQAE